jgi:hypothetical protein
LVNQGFGVSGAGYFLPSTAARHFPYNSNS